MSMPASASGVPPESLLVVAWWPDASMETRMFSTLCDVSDVQPFHVKAKTPLAMLDGFQLAKTSAEKSVSDEQPFHARAASLTEGSSVLKLSSDEQPRHAKAALVTEGSSVLKLVSEVQSNHAVYALLTEGRSELKLVSDEQSLHAA